MKTFIPSLLATSFLLAGCQSVTVGYIYTVADIEEHFPNGYDYYPDKLSYSDTILNVYRNGNQGETIEIICHFPPEVQLENNLSTPTLNEMRIPAKVRRVRDLFEQSEDLAYETMLEEDPDFTRTVQSLNNYDGDDINVRWNLRNNFKHTALTTLYTDYATYSSLEYTGPMESIPPLTGIRKIKLVGEGDRDSYSGARNYYCEKIE